MNDYVSWVGVTPSADTMAGAAALFEFMTAYQASGFTDEQAFTMTRDILREQVRASLAPKPEEES